MSATQAKPAKAAKPARAVVRTMRMASARVMAERSGLVISLAFYVLVVSVLSGLWRVAARAASTGQIAGYGAVSLSWYIATAEAATVSLNIRMIDDISREIASGAIATEMLRPASVLAHRVAREIGSALPRLLGCMVIAVPLMLTTAGPPPRISSVLLAVPSLVIAIACNVLAQHAFAASAFWLRNAGAAWFLYSKLVFVLGGMLLPLEVLPPWLRRTADLLPFRAMAYAPARLAAGHLEPMLLVQQIAWLGLIACGARAAFAAGEHRLQVVGG